MDLPPEQSAFLWGPRKTGKSTYLNKRYPDSVRYDFLKTDLVLQFSKRPALLREQLAACKPAKLAQPVILDEVQKVPSLLDEVHWLIENRGMRFILCGSSARKLKRGKANLLGGRAWRYQMLPLVTPEMDDPDLLKILNRGTIPAHFTNDQYRRSLSAYVRDYLKEEVFDEGLTRNVPAFSRFLDAVGFSQGELTNYANISRDCGVDAKTVREYYQILADTLLGSFVAPFKNRQDRGIILRTPKFYLFDVGVAGAIMKRRILEERGEEFGKAFEHFIFTEVYAHSVYSELDYDINFWRTKSGLEVDFILGGEVAVEVKGSSRVDNRDMRSLMTFAERYHPRKAFLVCKEGEARVVGSVNVVPWRDFLNALWNGSIIS